MTSVISENKTMMKAVLIGVFAAIAVIILLMCLATLVMLMTPAVPYAALDYIMLAIDGVGVAVGAYITAAINKSRGIITGLLCGFMVFLFLFIAGLCSGLDGIGYLTFIRLFLLLVIGMLAGIKGVNRKEKIHIK